MNHCKQDSRETCESPTARPSQTTSPNFYKAVGFMRSRSTASASVQVTDDLCKAVDKNFEVAVVFFDVRKAFDTVPHLNLLMLLHELGVNSYLVNWIKSYLLTENSSL